MGLIWISAQSNDGKSNLGPLWPGLFALYIEGCAGGSRLNFRQICKSRIYEDHIQG